MTFFSELASYFPADCTQVRVSPRVYAAIVAEILGPQSPYLDDNPRRVALWNSIQIVASPNIANDRAYCQDAKGNLSRILSLGDVPEPSLSPFDIITRIDPSTGWAYDAQGHQVLQMTISGALDFLRDHREVQITHENHR